jgi:hypothetical protein
MLGKLRWLVTNAVQPAANAATTWRESGVLTPVAALDPANRPRRFEKEEPTTSSNQPTLSF